MLEKVDLGEVLDKKAYKKEIEPLESRLTALQERIAELNIPVIIVFEGWSASGKGTQIAKVVHPLDPRYFNVYTMGPSSTDDAMRPYLWAYWTRIPERGRIAIFDKSWHRLTLPDAGKKRSVSETEISGYYYDVNAFEQQLNDDGYLIIKFFLHISADEQNRRFKELEKNAATRWRVDAGDWQQNREYAKYMGLYEEMLHKTNYGVSQWSVIEANDMRFATVKIFKTIINKMEREIDRRTFRKQHIYTELVSDIHPPEINILSAVDTKKTISDKEYKENIDYYQNKMAELGFKMYAKRRSVIIVYEGWDAAGKGGNIKRLTEHLDPRGYEVVPIAAPSQTELAHHYLWRFYNKLPKDGHMTIYDRSWYGRVLVERIEGLCTQEEWQRAYKEINDMELRFTNHGTIIFKFWMHIDKDEQIKRFMDRQNDPAKNSKLTDEDWRNREKWSEYESAVDEMLFRTNTTYAPWVIVEANYKKYARIKTLKTVVEELEKRLL